MRNNSSLLIVTCEIHESGGLAWIGLRLQLHADRGDQGVR